MGLRSAFLILALLLGSRVSGWAAEEPYNDISLADSYPVETLRKILLEREVWRPFPGIADRPGWESLPEAGRQAILQRGEEALAAPLPDLPATLYLEFARNGNRSRFEARHKGRRQMLHHLVLAECLEAKGRFLDAIANAAWAICEESSWCYPAHISVQKAGRGLPDIEEPIVDLFAAETGVSLSWTLYLLGTELDKVSPLLRPRMSREIDRRILTPFLDRNDFGWMAFYRVTRTHRPNNWNPWINASVLTSGLLTEPDPERRVQIVHKVLRSLDRFLLAYPADGSCDEGPGYWGHAGGSLFDSLELLHGASGGQLSVFEHPLIQEIGRFIYRAHISKDWFVPVGDCSAQIEIYRERVFRYGQRIGDRDLQALGASGATVESLLDSAGDRYFGRLLPAVFCLSEVLALPPASPPLVRDVWLGSEDMQLMAARDSAGTDRGFYVAAWGGHNGQSHNHNDVGNFIVFADGQPILVDVGVTTYTAKTFSNRRYEIWVMQSAFHNLPSINGQMQRAGSGAAASRVAYEANDAFAQVSLDIAGAYPSQAAVDSWERTIRLNRGKDVEITDRFRLRTASGVTAQHLMTPLEVVEDRPGKLVLALPGQAGGESRRVELTFDADAFTPTVEGLELDDDRLARVWGTHLNRVILRANTQPVEGRSVLRLSLER